MEYTSSDIISFLQQLPGEQTVFFTGGEPLLHIQFESMLNAIKQCVPNVTLGMFTSGIFNCVNLSSVSEEYAQRLASCGLAICYFSVYGSEEIHDWMTGVQGSYQLTKASMEHLLKYGVDVRFNSVVTQKNKEHIFELIDFASSLGASEVRLLKLIEHGRATQHWSELGISEEEYRQTVHNVLTKCPKIRITASSCTDMIACRPMPDAKGCQAGTRLLYVTFHGDVFPCASVKNNPAYKIGNVKTPIDWNNYWRTHGSFLKSALCSGVSSI